MPRRNRPRPRRGTRRPEPARDLDEARAGWRSTQHRHGVAWTVQPITAERAVKDYTCPGCGGVVPQGQAHVVVWRADGVLGDAADLAGRRHWHSHCWRIG